MYFITEFRARPLLTGVHRIHRNRREDPKAFFVLDNYTRFLWRGAKKRLQPRKPDLAGTHLISSEINGEEIPNASVVSCLTGIVAAVVMPYLVFRIVDAVIIAPEAMPVVVGADVGVAQGVAPFGWSPP